MGRRDEDEEIGRAPAATPGSPAFRPHGPRRREVELTGIGRITKHIGGVEMVLVITDAWVEYGGQRVTEVPEGEHFDILASYNCQWDQGSFWDPWKVAIAVSGNGISNIDSTVIRADRGSGTMKLDHDGPNIMPNAGISLTLTPWGHPEGATTTLPTGR